MVIYKQLHVHVPHASSHIYILTVVFSDNLETRQIIGDSCNKTMLSSYDHISSSGVCRLMSLTQLWWSTRWIAIDRRHCTGLSCHYPSRFYQCSNFIIITASLTIHSPAFYRRHSNDCTFLNICGTGDINVLSECFPVDKAWQGGNIVWWSCGDLSLVTSPDFQLYMCEVK